MLNALKSLFKAAKLLSFAPANRPAALADVPAINTVHLRWLFLVPVMVITFIMIGTLIFSAHNHATDEIDREVKLLRASSNQIYLDNLEHLTGMLSGISSTISQDAILRRALARRDRAELTRIVAPIYSKLEAEYEISHFYFIGADRTVLLRAHNPARFGDIINRVTTLTAQRTKEHAHGVELGPMGKLALRYVIPLYQDAAKLHLIGFVELGVDTNHLLMDIQESLGVQMYEFLSKDLLSRVAWQQELADPANSTKWDHFPDVTPSPSALKTITPEMGSLMAKGVFPPTDSLLEISHDGYDFRAISFPILDVEERNAGSIVMLVDVTSSTRNADRTLYLGLFLGIAGGGLLFALFWLLTGRVGLLIEQHRSDLHHMATRDGLTGMLNHISFYGALEEELARSNRSNSPVSLLMLDLDHFKGVNDKYGHVAGDTILKETGALINHLSRSTDKVCRYGGEEIAVVLSETGSSGAMLIAERMRASIEGHLFRLNDGREISITVSIGVASYPEHAQSAQQLVDVADQALYRAKEQGRNRVLQFKP